MNTQTVFKLRKEAKELLGIQKANKLNDALHIAKQLFQEDENDEWIQKAFAWILIDLCKYYIADNNLPQANVCYQKLLNINFEDEDDIIENQKTFLKPKIDTIYPDIKKAEELSKSGNHQEAINIIKILISKNTFTKLHHEAYGWIIYRYIKKGEDKLTSIQVRFLLRDYMNLTNERPSLLHSMILNFALHYSKDHSDFNFYNFFKLWNSENLRTEDKEKQSHEGKEYPSLISRIFRVFIDDNYKIEIDDLLESIELNSWKDDFSSNQNILDLLREPFFWKIFNAKRENNLPHLWQLFLEYNQKFAGYEKSKWHSKVLSLAERYMTDNDEWRFEKFFIEWRPINFLKNDWDETTKDGKVYKPLAIKCLKKSFDIIKSKKDKGFNLELFIDLYDKAILKFPNDYWLKRENALLLIKNKQYELASEIYKTLVLELGDKAYIWHEFTSCFNNNAFDIKIAMLSKAIQLEKNEDFLGEIRLDLATVLIENNFKEAQTELNIYKKHRETKGWKLSDKFTLLSKKTNNSSNDNYNNKDLYNNYIPKADEFAYSDIEWKTVVLTDKWEDNNGKDKCKLLDTKDISFVCNIRKFKELRKSELGQIFNVKLYLKHTDEGINFNYLPLLFRKTEKQFWSILPEKFAVVDYINRSKNVIHAITSDNIEIFFKDNIKKYQENDIIKGRLLETKKGENTRYDFKNIIKSTKEIAINSFTSHLALIDNVNQSKKLFHFVVNSSIQGIEYFENVKIQIQEGDFIKVWLVKKHDKKHNKIRYKIIEIKETEEKSENLKRELSAKLSLKYKKSGSTVEYFDLSETEQKELSPDFGFVGDFYVPKYLIKQNNITENCMVEAIAIFAGDKWKITKLIEVKNE